MIHDALILAAIFASGGLIGYIIGSLRGHKRGRDEQWVADYLAFERKSQAGRDNLGRFKKRKAPYGKIKITAQQNQL